MFRLDGIYVKYSMFLNSRALRLGPPRAQTDCTFGCCKTRRSCKQSQNFVGPVLLGKMNTSVSSNCVSTRWVGLSNFVNSVTYTLHFSIFVIAKCERRRKVVGWRGGVQTGAGVEMKGSTKCLVYIRNLQSFFKGAAVCGLFAVQGLDEVLSQVLWHLDDVSPRMHGFWWWQLWRTWFVSWYSASFGLLSPFGR